MVFARIGHGSCYYHWNEIFAGVTSNLISDLSKKLLTEKQLFSWFAVCYGRDHEHAPFELSCEEKQKRN